MKCEVCGEATERLVEINELQYDQISDKRPLCSDKCEGKVYLAMQGLPWESE